MNEPARDVFIFFGATGDLAFKEIFPSLQALVSSGELDIPIVAVAFEDWDIDRVRAYARESIETHGTIDEASFAKLSSLMHYVQGDYNDASTYERLRDVVNRVQSDRAYPLIYLAVPPSLFGRVVQGLHAVDLASQSRVLVEKPFGRDLPSARELNRILTEILPETSIYRIDHFLGKEAVQNLLYFRFANALLGPMWCREHIASIQVNLAESFGIDGRGKFYDSVGAIRDVVQNHLLQVLCILLMEQPRDTHPDSIRDAKVALLQAIEPLRPEDVVLGQFEGYHDVPGVMPDSRTETFAALSLRVNNDEWRDVPILIMTGKRLPVTVTEILVEFRTPQLLFAVPGWNNYFRYRIVPRLETAIGAMVKEPGEELEGVPVELVAQVVPGDVMSPYERLLGDALEGDPTLFARQDAIEAAWSVVDPVLSADTPTCKYAAGTWGPAEVPPTWRHMISFATSHWSSVSQA